MDDKKPFIVTFILLLCLGCLVFHQAAGALDLSLAASIATARASTAGTDPIEIEDTEGDDILPLFGRVSALMTAVLLVSIMDRTLNSPFQFLSHLFPPPKVG